MKPKNDLDPNFNLNFDRDPDTDVDLICNSDYHF